MKTQLTLLATIVLSGCAATGPAFTPAPVSNAKKALVYIYRVDSFALGGRDAYFYVDDQNVADLSRNGYTWFHAPAGKHELKQKWPVDVSLYKKLETSVNWESGHSYYYRFVTFSGESSYPTIKIHWHLSEVPAGVAMNEMQTSKLQEAFGASKLNVGGSDQ